MPSKPAQTPPSTRYVAFLRGINVGGNRIVKMDALAGAFEKAGMKKVKTILASGNVLFESSSPDSAEVCEMVEAGLEKLLGHPVGVVIRTLAQVETLARKNPFKDVTVTPETRLWVTLLKETTSRKREVFTVLQVTTPRAGVDQMTELDRKYGKTITTRSWNTIHRILKAAATS